MADLFLLIGNKKYSSWSLRPWLVLKQAGLAFDERQVPLDRPDTRANILKFSPTGKVPFLRHGKVEVWESLAICEYLAEAFPAAGLWPKDVAARAQARAVSNEMHAGFGELRRYLPMDVSRDLKGENRAHHVAGDIARIQQIWTECRQRFGKEGPFLFGRRLYHGFLFNRIQVWHNPGVITHLFFRYFIGQTAQCGTPDTDWQSSDIIVHFQMRSKELVGEDGLAGQRPTEPQLRPKITIGTGFPAPT